MDSRIQIHEYEDITTNTTDGHTYEPIKTVQKDHSVLISRKQWSIIFILILAASLVYSSIGLAVTHFTSHSLIDMKMANIDRIDELSQSNTSIAEIKKMILENSERVGFTSCGGEIAYGSRIKFTLLRSSHSINVSSSYDEGRFSPNKAGFYLVLSNILSNSQDGYFIRQNGIEIARAWTRDSDSHATPRYTASLAAYVHLS